MKPVHFGVPTANPRPGSREEFARIDRILAAVFRMAEADGRPDMLIESVAFDLIERPVVSAHFSANRMRFYRRPDHAPRHPALARED